ncbi:hypothetical protein P154DRAFT_588375 [Amniculicola lignicola CBS 123094]|uniref:F-box domain-containing protein n=1 Tax=Amniculicola lignicola CBS 123094 TaxID=1392246 RepID=A0A6A5VV60_9PLEO|nr:hypothetical protein P154DRAFT_588375 [Amniculicola lignicola CBS 123094]
MLQRLTLEPTLLSLQDLPVEITQNVCEYLGDASLLSLQLVCLGLRAKSYYIFGQRFFPTIKSSLHSYSFQALTQIIERKGLATHVQNVTFGLEDPGLICPDHRDQVLQLAPVHTSAAADDEFRIFYVKNLVFKCLLKKVLKKCPKIRMFFIGLESQHGAVGVITALFRSPVPRTCVSQMRRA